MVGQDGYSWWYVDALSADGRHGLTIIAFIGSVFSPYYALARARGRGDPENHVCMNVALDGQPRRWAMTERGRASLRRDTGEIAIGRSAMRWSDGGLRITIDEPTVPLPGRIRGTVTITPRIRGTRTFQLDGAGRHLWQPIAPLCDVEAEFETPAMSWKGTGYFDTNHGEEPLEAAFRSWTWTRFEDEHGARIVYDVTERSGAFRPLSLQVDADGVREVPPPMMKPLPRTVWGVERMVPCDSSATPSQTRMMENAPFYARCGLSSLLDGKPVLGVNESLSLTRVAHPVVRLMLPFKMFRRASAADGRVG